MRAWLVVSPVIAAGVLASHALAYRLTSTPNGPFHEYLAHAPQVLLLLALAALALAGFGPRRDAPPAWAFPVVAVATFVAQEHVERLVHDGGVPMLLTTGVFLAGLALQVPVALVTWVIARRVLTIVAGDPPRVSLRPRLEFPLGLADIARAVVLASVRPPSRGPPVSASSR